MVRVWFDDATAEGWFIDPGYGHPIRVRRVAINCRCDTKLARPEAVGDICPGAWLECRGQLDIDSETGTAHINPPDSDHQEDWG